MNLMKFKKYFFLISAIVIVPGLISLFMFGLKPAIDFTGGSLLELKFLDGTKFESYSDEKFREISAEQLEINSLQPSEGNALIIKAKTINNEDKDFLVEEIVAEYGAVEVLRFETVGPLLGAELLKKTIAAVILVAGVITLYVWRQFDELKYGVSAVLAMFHDSLVLLGAFSILGHFFNVEVDVLFVTAVLTTLSFSIHDTIVVYDRIRELRKKHRRLALEEVANAAVLETLSRSINNSITIILMLFALVLLGGDSIQHFSLALLIGAITGTYSSTFTAVPLLIVWEELAAKKKS